MKRLNVTIIGSGNVATHLGLALRESGHSVAQVYGRRHERARWLARRVQAEAVDDLGAIRPGADAYLMAVSDDAIQELAGQLRLPGCIVAHTSGATTADALAPVSDMYGVFYPLQSFKIDRKVDWTEIPVLVTGTDKVETMLSAIARDLSRHVQTVTDVQRMALHLAAVFVNNFTNHNFTLAREVAHRSGVDFELLGPLAHFTVEQALQHNPSELQTGPARRGDLKTIQKHLDMLKDIPGAEEVYAVLSKRIGEWYKEFEV